MKTAVCLGVLWVLLGACQDPPKRSKSAQSRSSAAGLDAEGGADLARREAEGLEDPHEEIDFVQARPLFEAIDAAGDLTIELRARLVDNPILLKGRFKAALSYLSRHPEEVSGLRLARLYEAAGPGVLQRPVAAALYRGAARSGDSAAKTALARLSREAWMGAAMGLSRSLLAGAAASAGRGSKAALRERSSGFDVPPLRPCVGKHCGGRDLGRLKRRLPIIDGVAAWPEAPPREVSPELKLRWRGGVGVEWRIPEAMSPRGTYGVVQGAHRVDAPLLWSLEKGRPFTQSGLEMAVEWLWPVGVDGRRRVLTFHRVGLTLPWRALEGESVSAAHAQLMTRACGGVGVDVDVTLSKKPEAVRRRGDCVAATWCVASDGCVSVIFRGAGLGETRGLLTSLLATEGGSP